MNGLQELKSYQKFARIANLKIGMSVFRLYHIGFAIFVAISIGLFRMYIGL